MTARYALGIDLGTTHCALASARLDKPRVRVLDVPQLIAPGEIDARPLLPSFLYLHDPSEFPAHEVRSPVDANPPVPGIVGELARQQGAKVPDRLVASAKSWVCHGGAHRYAPILPWNAPEGSPHVSPYTAEVAYLQHLAHAWSAAHGGAVAAEQDVVVTVPASFDESARELTIAAAREAGLGEVRLLEEPQAAFYDFLGERAQVLTSQFPEARLILVVDVGGGTTDVTLLRVNEGDNPAGRAGATDAKKRTIERIAVGGHLMLGGDNMDAALALFALEKAGIERPEDAGMWSKLVQSARVAKERLLGPDAPDSAVLSYTTRSSRLVGSTKSLPVTRDEATRILVDGFFAFTSPTEVAAKTSRSGLTTLGLPYASDPAITRHLAAFLRRHVDAAREASARVYEGLPRPDLVLLNGGVFKAPALRERLSAVLCAWFGEAVPFLEPTSLDVAVARGAVRFALGRRGLGELIGGGTARAYYLGVETAGSAPRALCVAPRGMDDDTTITVPDRVFELVVDRPVRFPFFAYTGDRVDRPGALASVTDDELEPLPPVETLLRAKSSAGSRASQGTLGVTLEARRNERGALELSFVGLEVPPPRWRIAFALHGDPGAALPPGSRAASADAPAGDESVDASVGVGPEGDPRRGGMSRGGSAGPKKLPAEVLAGVQALRAALSSREPEPVRELRRLVEAHLGPRDTWSLEACRALFDACVELAACRRTSATHELSWLRFFGFCLRPGFGADGDEARREEAARLRRDGLAFPSKAHFAEWWITWRRVAPGLTAPEQRAIFEDVSARLWPSGDRPPGAHGLVEMIQLAASLEWLSAHDKERLGELALERATKLGSFGPVGRAGGRVAFHARGAEVVPPAVAERWIARLLAQGAPLEESALFAAAAIARVTGDPARDVAESVRREVASRLARIKAPGSFIEMVSRVTSLSTADESRLLGDSLPVGLRLS